MQPAQQQGRRIPSKSSVCVLSIRRLLVSGFLADSIQQIHSLRASGVISSHAASDAGEEIRIFRKSSGTLCTTPAEISFLVISLSYLLPGQKVTLPFANLRSQIPLYYHCFMISPTSTTIGFFPSSRNSSPSINRLPVASKSPPGRLLILYRFNGFTVNHSGKALIRG